MTDAAMVVDAVFAPEVPVIVTVTGPVTVAFAAAVRVSVVPVEVGFVVNAAVTPLGKPVATRVTLPVNAP